ncbi:MAG: hypothetical protein V3T77_03330, partial [Planctomycetota bacterium]
MTRRSSLWILVLVLLSSALWAQTPDPLDFELTCTDVGGPQDSEQVVTILFDNPNATIDIDGWQMAICHDDTLVQPIDFMCGETTLIINGGEPPDLVFTQIVPGEGVSMGVVINISLLAVLEPGSGYELLEITYLLTGSDGKTAEITSDPDCVVKMVNTVFVYNGGANFVIPTTFPCFIEIGGQEPFFLTAPTMEGGAGQSLTAPITLENPLDVYGFSFGFSHGPEVV